MNPFTGLRDDGTDPWTGKYVDKYNAHSDNASNDNKAIGIIRIMDQGRADTESMNARVYPKPITKYAKAVGTSRGTNRSQNPHKMSPFSMKCVSIAHSYFNHLSKVIR